VDFCFGGWQKNKRSFSVLFGLDVIVYSLFVFGSSYVCGRMKKLKVRKHAVI